MWLIQGDTNGIWQGVLSTEEEEKGGEWRIGTDLPQGHPGNIRWDPLYKTWADPESKYGGEGHKGGPGADGTLPHGGRMEFVQVMVGSFLCESEGGTRELAFPDYEDFPPHVHRVWKRLSGARGLTLCRHQAKGLSVSRHVHYDFSVIGTQSRNIATAVRKLAAPRQAGLAWKWQYVEPFDGYLDCMVHGHQYHLDSRSCLYIPRGCETRWNVQTTIRAAVIYY